MTLAVALVVVGDELLTGGRQDTNGPWLAERLTRLGATVVGLEACGDDAESVARAVRAAVGRARGVVVSGGLGPTRDDATRDGLARAAEVELVEAPEALAALAATLEARGLELDAGRRRQALVPRGGRWLPNPEGTAGGLEVAVGDAIVWALPGVPRELKAMFDVHVAGAVGRLGGLEAVAEAAIPTAGVPEADVASLLDDVVVRPGLSVGLYPHEGEVTVRVRARGADAAAEVARAVDEMRRRLGPAAWASGRIEDEVVRLLAAADRTVTTAESMTGGLVARMLTEVPGASRVFPGGWVTYSDAWKIEALGVPAELVRTDGAVSPAVARAMADAARRRAGTDAALAVTGVAGPGDDAAPGGAAIPQGTFHVAAALAGRETEVRSQRQPLARTAVQRRAAVAVLDVLRRMLIAAP